MLLGVDTGGTFTDFVLLADGRCRIHKVLSSPDDPARAILQGISDLALQPVVERAELRVVHGSTIATNAALEGKGVTTVYIGNRGFTDLLHIGRQNRSDIYDLCPTRPALPLEPDHCLATGGRIDSDGKVIEALTADDIQHLREQIQVLQPQAIAINLLYSYVDDRWERLLQEALEDLAFTTRSSFVLPEHGEYERGMATFLNAWLGPVVGQYLTRLSSSLAPSEVSVMQSSGSTISAAQASLRAVNLLMSGPAGGLAAATHLAATTHTPNLMTFDMGGTSTDVALIQGKPTLTREGRVGPYPVAIPMADIHTIGAGGGSIAYIDAGGSLQLGPESAGADPGPACYGRGGVQPTVTDANVVLGRLPHSTLLGGSLALDQKAALAVLQPLAQSLQCSLAQAAQGICDLANEHMVRALRVISLERGFDPARFTLLCYGGAGGLHVCALAQQLGIRRIIIPADAGVFSAFGMLVANPGREVVKTWNQELGNIQEQDILKAFQETGRDAETELVRERGHGEGNERGIETQQSVDLRYAGQTFSLTLPWNGLESLAPEFHRAHKNRFGHAFDLPVELVNLRLRLTLPRKSPRFEPVTAPAQRSPESPGVAEQSGVEGMGQVDIVERNRLRVGEKRSGPVLIRDPVSTTFVDPGWEAVLGLDGHLRLNRLSAG